MRKWQTLGVTLIEGKKYDVVYLLDGRERRRARVDATFGLEWAIAETGKQLASMPPMIKPTVGNPQPKT